MNILLNNNKIFIFETSDFLRYFEVLKINIHLRDYH